MSVRLLPLLTVLACVPPVEEGSGEDARFLLEAWEDFPERARVLEGATASFGDGPLFEGESTLQREVTVARIHPNALDVVLPPRGAGIELLARVANRDLALVPVEPVFTSGDRGIQLPAGATVTIDDTSGNEVHVRYEKHVVEVDAWMPRDALDVYWREVVTPPPFELQWDAHALAGHTELFDAPEGERVGFVRPISDTVHPFHPVQVMEHWQGWTRVRGDQTLPFDAWVPSDQVHAANVGYGFGGGWSCGGHGRLGMNATVAGGAWLYDGPQGAVVGRTTRDVYLSLRDEADGWASATYRTPLGAAILWIGPGDRLEGA